MIIYTNNLRKAIKKNKKLPKPKYPITASFDFLNISLPRGFQINPVDPKELGDNEYVEQNKKKIYWGIDGTLYAMQNNYSSPVIGDGVAPYGINNLISNPWTRYFWSTKINKEKKLKHREGWCFATSMKREHKDAVIDAIATKHMDLFQVPNNFVYDWIDDRHSHLIQKMCRTIDRQDKPTSYSYSAFGGKNHNTDLISSQAPWHINRLIELVPESRQNFFYVTEKTLKPIASGMPFVIVGCHRFLQQLRHIGFRTFHPFIDESYDNEEDMMIRVEKAVSSIKIFVKDPQNLDQIQKICDHNIDILKKIQSYKYYDKIWKKMRRFIEL